MKELTRFEIAAVKRIAANTKTLRGKVEKLNAKIAELTTMKATYLNEIAMWESPIVDKYGYTVDQILDGSYLIPTCNEEVEEFEDNNDNLEYPSETFDNTL
jgi:uncharacterized protein YkvS